MSRGKTQEPTLSASILSNFLTRLTTRVLMSLSGSELLPLLSSWPAGALILRANPPPPPRAAIGAAARSRRCCSTALRTVCMLRCSFARSTATGSDDEGTERSGIRVIERSKTNLETAGAAAEGRAVRRLPGSIPCGWRCGREYLPAVGDANASSRPDWICLFGPCWRKCYFGPTFGLLASGAQQGFGPRVRYCRNSRRAKKLR